MGVGGVEGLVWGVAHIYFAGNYIGDEAHAVFLEQFYLSVCAGYGGVDICCCFVEVFDDGALLGEGWDQKWNLSHSFR